jgi:hypothetical protein
MRGINAVIGHLCLEMKLKNNSARCVVQISVLDKPIERNKETCAMMGIAEKLDHVLPDLGRFWKRRWPREKRANPSSPLKGCFVSRSYWQSARLVFDVGSRGLIHDHWV